MTASAPERIYYDSYCQGKFALQLRTGDKVEERIALDARSVDGELVTLTRTATVTAVDSVGIIGTQSRLVCTLDNGSTYERLIPANGDQVDPAQDRGWTLGGGCKIGGIEGSAVLVAKLFPPGHDHEAQAQRIRVGSRLAQIASKEMFEGLKPEQVDALEAVLVEQGLLKI